MIFSIFKSSHTSEKTTLEFRSEFFNVLNHTNFLFAQPGSQSGNNATILGTPQFGFVTAARDARKIQFALKFSFSGSYRAELSQSSYMPQAAA